MRQHDGEYTKECFSAEGLKMLKMRDRSLSQNIRLQEENSVNASVPFGKQSSSSFITMRSFVKSASSIDYWVFLVKTFESH